VKYHELYTVDEHYEKSEENEWEPTSLRLGRNARGACRWRFFDERHAEGGATEVQGGRSLRHQREIDTPCSVFILCVVHKDVITCRQHILRACHVLGGFWFLQQIFFLAKSRSKYNKVVFSRSISPIKSPSDRDTVTK